MKHDGGNLSYKQLPPPPYLAEFVLYFWTLECPSDGSTKTFGPLADGCPGLILQRSEKMHMYAPDNKELPMSFIYGQSIRLTHLHLTRNYNLIGIRFFPNALKSIFGFNASELTDSCLDLSSLLKAEDANFSEKLDNSPSTSETLKLLSHHLFSLIRKKNSQLDPVTGYAVSRIINSKGRVSLKEIRENLNLSERSLERKFDQFVGIPPKLYARVCRFQAALNQLKSNQYSKLSDIAFDNGFSDQSHFIRTFKEFAGHSPFEFQKQADYVGENVPVA